MVYVPFHGVGDRCIVYIDILVGYNLRKLITNTFADGNLPFISSTKRPGGCVKMWLDENDIHY